MGPRYFYLSHFLEVLMRSLRTLLICAALGSPSFAQPTASDSLRELSRKVDILIEELERSKLGEVADTAYVPQRGLGPAAAKVYQVKKTGVSLAGYGEVLYENFAEKRDDASPSNRLDQLDFLRHVVYFGFRYNDWIVFNSEVEFEHATTGKRGTVSVEFGYIELMLSKHFNLRAGMVLPPLGIINEKHEPSTFFSAQRPQVERVIIPSTWRTNGIGFYGEIVPDLNYRAYLVEGFDAKSFSDVEGVRGGRQSGSFSLVEDFGYTGKVEYQGLPGTTIAASFYYGNSGQGAKDSLGTISAATSIVSAHVEFAYKGFELRALVAQTHLDQAGRVSVLARKTIASKTNGWYVVGGYDLIPVLAPGSEQSLIPFVQYEKLNTHAEVDAGFAANPANSRSALTFGINYKPHPNVAFKFDYTDAKNRTGTGVDQWNLAVAYLY